MFCIKEKLYAVHHHIAFDHSGIEIEVATNYNHRRKGLATIVSAALILDCLEKEIYPNWDAANTTSAKLAEKLGYVFDKAYDTYFVDNR